MQKKKSLLEFPLAFVIFIDERWITNERVHTLWLHNPPKKSGDWEIVLTHYDTNGKCAFDYITM